MAGSVHYNEENPSQRHDSDGLPPAAYRTARLRSAAKQDSLASLRHSRTLPAYLACTTMTTDYLKKILTARVYDVAIETPLELRADAVAAPGQPHLLQARGHADACSASSCAAPTTRWRNLTPAQLKRGVICASAGNHAQGVALSAARLGCRAMIVMPATTPQVKIDAVRRAAARRGGAARRLVHRRLQPRADAGEEAASLTFVHPFDDPDVIAGQGTIGMEILRQHSGPDPRDLRARSAAAA